MMDYIILDIGKVIINREEDVKKYYKEVDGKLVELSQIELLKVIKTFNQSNGYDYDSEKLISLVNNNSTIEPNNREYVLKLLEFLERVIPDDCRDNFYRNLETITIKLNFDYDFSNLTDMENNDFYSEAGGYNTRENRLTIKPETLKKTWDISQKASNPNDFYFKHVSQVVLHELCHMASSNYNNDTTVSLSGFDKYPSDTENDRNRGLTEGMTEVISMAGIPGTVEIASGYYIEALFVNQLIQIVGVDVLSSSYFSNKGTIKIQNKLNEIIDNRKMSNCLFRRIEDNFQVRTIDAKQTFLGNIQTTLITYFNVKMNKMLAEKQIDYDDIIKEFDRFEQMLVTPQKLVVMKKIQRIMLV